VSWTNVQFITGLKHRQLDYFIISNSKSLNSIMITFADDTAVMAVGETAKNSNRKLQSAVNKVAISTKKIVNKTNESKSVHIDFTIKKIRQKPMFINGTQVPYSNTAKYLGMTFDAKLPWKKHGKEE
jgi:hypothetical protein